MKRFIILGGFIISLVFPRRDCLKQAETDALGRSMRPEKEIFSISDSGHFYIHYDTTGNAAPNLIDTLNNGNGIPDYIDEVSIIADSARHVLVNMMGFAPPPVDEDSIYDIYIESYSSGVYGYNYKDDLSQNTSGTTSYIQIDNDYSGFNSIFNLTPMQIMQIAVGHEYFHGIQWGYEKNLGENSYFYEMTSMWFEDILIPDGNDYLDGWADPLLNNPKADFDNTGGGYELALFGHYLSSFIDTTGRVEATKSTIIREIWERFDTTSSNVFSSMKFVLENSYKISFIEAWTDFMSRNLYNGIYEDMDNDFYYYIDQALIDPIETTATLLTDSASFELELDIESVAIQSYRIDYDAVIGNHESIISMNHDSNNYTGRFAIVSTGNEDKNNLIWGKDTAMMDYYSDVEIHFVYGVNESNLTLPIDVTLQTVPLPPANLSVLSAQDSILLYWESSPGPGNSLTYILYRNADSIYALLDTHYVDKQSIEGQISYTYYITCFNDIGESQPSNTITIQSWPYEENVTQNQILSIYPNPMHKTHDAHILYALGTNSSSTILELINIRGQIVKTVALQSYQRGWHRESINNLVLPEASSGIYILRLRSDNGLGRTQKITILP